MATASKNKNLKRFINDDIFIESGAFGDVYGPCIWKEKTCAIKRICKPMENFEEEHEICKKWMALDHRNLISVYDVSFEPPALYILMEYGSSRSLNRVLERCKSDLPPAILTDWSMQIAEGMAFLHRKITSHKESIIHRDLKSQNIIIMEPDAATNPHGKTLKIIDFEQICVFDDTAEMPISGSYAWMAPEVLESGYFSEASDVWSYGVVLWEMLTREVPYKGVPATAIMLGVMKQTLKLKVPDSCPDIFKTIVKYCLCYGKRGRPLFDEIVSALQSPQNQGFKGAKDSMSGENGANMSSRPAAILRKVKRFLCPTRIKNDKTATIAKALPVNKSDEPITRHRKFLEERMEPDFGLLEKLLANRTLSEKGITEVKAKSSLHKRNSQLLDYILEKHQGDRLIEALRDTGQTHIVNYVDRNGEYNPECGEEWPFTFMEISTLYTNKESLIDLVDLSVLLGLLHYSAKVINKTQLDFISSKPTPQSKFEALLDILYRCSFRDYRQLISCFRQLNQRHIAEVLESGEGIVKVHTHLEGPSDKVTLTEDEIVAKITDVLNGTSIVEKSRILDRLQARLIGALQGQSIVLYIWCETMEEVLHLHDLLTNGRLKNNVEQLFNYLLIPSQKVAVKDITMNDEEFERMKAHFTEIESASSVVESEVDLTKMEEIESASSVVESEVDLTEMEVDVTQVHESDVQESGKEMEPVYMVDDREVEPKAMEVDVAKLPELGSVVSGKEPAETEDEKKQGDAERMGRTEEPMTIEDINTAIMRNNNDFFSQHLKLRGVINKLHEADILSDEDTRYIKTLDHVSEKIDEVLTVIRNSSAESYDVFLSLLRESGQTLVADVADKGGVVLKVKVLLEPMENLEEVEKQIVEKLNHLQDKTVPKSEEVWRFLSQLKRGNIEIVGSQQEKGVVIWCWCRSQSALKTFEDICFSDVKQPNLLNGLFNLLLPGKSLPAMSSVYLESHEDEIVCREPRKISSQSEKSFSINERQAIDVAILQTKICLLCRSPNAIIVYEEGDLLKPSEELSLNDVITPMDMAYSKESNCLYITDEGRASVWKIAFPSPGNKVDLWLDAGAGDPFTLSVTNDGRVVMVKRGPPSSLEIYHPDSRLLLHLDLPSPILKPNHAVETSKGNLVVAYDKDVGIQGGICEISKEGQLLSRLDSMFEAISSVAQIVNSLLARLARLANAKFMGFGYLALDNNDEVYVCDNENGELAVFDSRLFLLNKKSDLNAVHRVHYFKEQMQLLVLHGSQKNKVSVFKLEVNC